MGGKGILRRPALALIGLILALGVVEGRAQQTGAASTITYAAQGWLDADRETFYTTSQGSHLIPYAWFKALRRTDVAESFAADKLLRYGYLAHDVSPANPEGLPVGFVIDGPVALGQLGLTCAACHTGQLEYKKDGETRAIRIDGAPAKSDFQQFLTDLREASKATLADPGRFDTFARAVLGPGFTAAKSAQLKGDFGKWVAQFAEFMDLSLPPNAWGPGRLDAFGMIFNRVAARDIGMKGNFKFADAPVRYPFLWNASRQDHTQWNGGVPNGLYIQALGRNAGEVIGVFADFAPHRDFPATPLTPALIDFKNNSINFGGLETLEEKIAALKPPPWPREIFGLDAQLAAKGEPLFDANCGRCHAMVKDARGLWRTPVLAVGTDPKMLINSHRPADPGLLTGALMPPPSLGGRIGNPAKAGDILAVSVVGALLGEAFPSPLTLPSPAKVAQSGVYRALRTDIAEHFPEANLDALLNPGLSPIAKLGSFFKLQAFLEAQLSDMFKPLPPDEGAAYEARVLNGVWAVAPYLHNGSVPNLWELMKPAKDRMSTFKVGSRIFDPKNVGYATDDSPFKTGAFIADPNNGNGNGGHEYGTGLTEGDRWAIIEYMKTF